MKKTFFFAVIATLSLYSCGTPLFFSITDGGENFKNLTKITDREGQCIDPYGGDNGRNLFFAVREDGRWTIYLKENVLSTAMVKKTSGTSDNSAPVYSETLGKIAYQSQYQGISSSDIFMINTVGVGATQITSTSDAFELNPNFSPDGKLIAYDKVSSAIANMNGSVYTPDNELWIKNLETGENILITNGFDPMFSPDGKRIVYAKLTADGRCSIWTMALDGSNQTQVSNTDHRYSEKPCWSPDGKRIIYQTNKEDKRDYDIYIMDADGGNTVQITNNNSYDGNPYWTTDGYIYFVSDRGGKQGNKQIWRFKLGE
jgi:TolB protein